jgi:acyl-CoA thioesterase-1
MRIPQDLRIAFLGDSFVNGTGDPTCLGWTGRTAAALAVNKDQVTYYNLGVRRDTSVEILARWHTEALPRLPYATPRGPVNRRVVVSFGVGDTLPDRAHIPPDQPAGNLRSLLREAAALDPPIPVFVVGPPPVADPEHTTRVLGLSAALGQACDELGVFYLPVVESLQAAPSWLAEARSGDGYHPGAAGYAELADLVAASPAWRDWLAQTPTRVGPPPTSDRRDLALEVGGTRYSLALRHTDETVEGALLREGAATPEPFSGWLELLRLLEAAGPPR